MYKLTQHFRVTIVTPPLIYANNGFFFFFNGTNRIGTFLNFIVQIAKSG